jgi:hypothetical protein
VPAAGRHPGNPQQLVVPAAGRQPHGPQPTARGAGQRPALPGCRRRSQTRKRGAPASSGGAPTGGGCWEVIRRGPRSAKRNVGSHRACEGVPGARRRRGVLGAGKPGPRVCAANPGEIFANAEI